MVYIKRLEKILLSLLCFIARVTLRIFLILLACIQVFTTLAFVPVLLVLQLIEIILVHPIYYIVTGHRYKEKYNTAIDMFGDFMYVTGKIRLRNDADDGYRDGDWYHDRWEAIKDIKVEL